MNRVNETEISEVRNSKAKQFILEVVQHLRNLAKETDEVKKSEFFKQYLETMSKFWKYSYHNQLLGDNYKGFLDALMGFCESKKIKVDFRNLGINGLYGYSKGGQIAITNTESINTQVNTMIHEVAHEILHRGKMLSKQELEIQAEGVAYVVTKHFGMENRSFNYLALYDANYKKELVVSKK
jgi:hypothetical protein